MKKRKSVYGMMIAALMSAAVSATACGGQKSSSETMMVQTQPHDDSRISDMSVSSRADQEDIQKVEELFDGYVGMANPFMDNETLKGAEENVGFSIRVPDEIGGVSASAFRNLGQEMLEVIYYKGDQEVARIRKSLNREDNSGNYVDYSEIQNVKIDIYDVTLKGNDGKVVLATWNDGTYGYSISVDETGVSMDEMTALVKAVR